MIETELDNTANTGQIILCPNSSAQWRTNVYFLYIVAIFAISIAIAFAAVGLWLVLPFTGFEIVALFLLFYYVARKCQHMEVIYISAQSIVIESGYNTPLRQWQCERFWVRVVIKKHARNGELQKILLRCREQELEIGSFLNQNDKRQLQKELSQFLPTLYL